MMLEYLGKHFDKHRHNTCGRAKSVKCFETLEAQKKLFSPEEEAEKEDREFVEGDDENC